MNYPSLLSLNVYDKLYKGRFLVVGTCVSRMAPEIMKHYEKDWKNVVSVCLEQSHYNMFVAKMFDTLALGNTKEVGFLTMDGSPHCIQLHFASKYLMRGLKKDVNFKHFVIKNNSVYEVSIENIDKSKDLSLVGSVLS